jgi:hypothetical protein
MKLRCRLRAAFTVLALLQPSHMLTAAELRIPAFTAYMQPDPESADISESHGVTHWTDATQSVNWYGKFKATGELTASVELRLPAGVRSRLRLTVGGMPQETTVDGEFWNIHDRSHWAPTISTGSTQRESAARRRHRRVDPRWSRGRRRAFQSERTPQRCFGSPCISRRRWHGSRSVLL